MPRPTDRFPFEKVLADWALDFTRNLTGKRLPFFVGLRDDGTVRRVYLSPPSQAFDAARKTTLAESYSGWILFAPYDDGPELYLEWLGLQQDRAEVWLGRPLTDDDLQPTDGSAPLSAWPTAWRVIVG